MNALFAIIHLTTVSACIVETLIQIEKNVSKWSKIIYIYYPMPRYVISQNSNLGGALLTVTMKKNAILEELKEKSND